MQISVIIPVYKAERFLTDAIASALSQEETAEIILIEDGSPDHSLEVCTHFAENHPNIRLLRHPNGQNKGASASRNLGMRNARFPFIAFLDADDMYLENRFSKTREVFDTYPDADGVHESIGVRYYDESMREMHVERVGRETTGVIKFIHPIQLFRTLATGKFGHIHLNGLVLKRESLDESLYFDPELTQCEDSDLMFQLASCKKLYSGDLSRVVAQRGVHPENRVFDQEETIEFKRKYLKKCIDHNFYGSRDAVANLYVIVRYISASPAFIPFSKLGPLSKAIRGIFSAGFLLVHPKVLISLVRVVLHQTPAIEPVRDAPYKR